MPPTTLKNQALSGAVREFVLAARTYYVRTDGSDSNTGLVNTAGGAFLTIQKAVDVASALDNGGNDITIQIGNGTYTITTPILLKTFVGAGKIIVQGDTTTPANVVVSESTASKNGFTANGVLGVYQIQGIKMTGSSAYIAIHCLNSVINFKNIDFSTGWAYHLVVEATGTIYCLGNYTISGGCTVHAGASTGVLFLYGVSPTVTLTGTPAWSNAMIGVDRNGFLIAYGVIFSGAATGKRYTVVLNGVVDTLGSGASFFPGNVAGTTATGGQYQ